MPSLFSTASSTSPTNIDILVLPSFSLLSLASTMEPLRAANRVAARTLYRWRRISANGRAVATSSGVALPVDAAFDPASRADALIIIASFDVERTGKPLLPGLRKLARRGVPLGGVEAGSWVLARAGLLDGHRATTHWEDLTAFAEAFPAVDVVPDRFVIDGGRFTTGGATPALDMTLELIRAQHGMSLALDVASVFIYDAPHAAADPQRIVSPGRLPLEDPRVAAAIRLMEERLAEPIAMAEVAVHVGLSPRGLEVAFQRHVGTSPGAFALDLRLKAARRMLSHPRLSIAEIADAAGFGSASAFARSYRARFGESPRQSRRLLSGSLAGPRDR